MPLVATFFPKNAMQKAAKQVAKELKKFIAETIPDDIDVTPIITEGEPAEQIVGQAKALKADLIIIPSHAKSKHQVLLGSCAAKVVEQAKCSVTVVKN